MSTTGESGGLSGGSGGNVATIHGGRDNDSRKMADGLDTGWAGGNGSGAQANVAGAQEVVLSTSGGLGEADTSGVVMNVIPRDGGNTFSGTVFASGASGTARVTVEASGYNFYNPSHIQQATWSSPLTSRVLLEAGWGTSQGRYRNPSPRRDGTHNPLMIRTQEQGGEIPNLISRMPGGVGQGFNHHLIGTLAANRASISYMTGAYRMKYGYQGGFSNPSQTYYYFNEVFFVRMNNGVPNRISQTIIYPGGAKYVRNLLPANFYGQDQWTSGKLTLQGGVRYDHL